MSASVGAVARRYSKALWMAASGSSEAASWLQELKTFSIILRDSIDLQQALLGFSVSDDKKQEILKSVLSAAGASPSVEKFLRAVFSAGRLSALADIADAFERLIDADEKVLRCVVETAYALDSAKKERLLKKLESVLSARVKLIELVEPRLVAGLRVKIMGANGDVVRVLDGSFATSLDVLKRNLSNETARA